MLDNKTTTDCRNKRIKEAKIRSFLKSVVVCFVRHLTDYYTKSVPFLNPLLSVLCDISLTTTENDKYYRISRGHLHIFDISHRSPMKLDGVWLLGPATRNLDRYPVKIEDDKIWVNTSTLIPGQAHEDYFFCANNLGQGKLCWHK